MHCCNLIHMGNTASPFEEIESLLDDIPAALRVVVKLRGGDQKVIAAQAGVAESVLSRTLHGQRPSLANGRKLGEWLARL